MRNKKVLFTVQAAAIAAIYVVLTVLFAPIGFGSVQVRFSEALTVLPYFTPAAIPGLFVGCFIGNILGGAIPLDIICGRKSCYTGRCRLFLHASQKKISGASAASRSQRPDCSIRTLLRIRRKPSDPLHGTDRRNWRSHFLLRYRADRFICPGSLQRFHFPQQRRIISYFVGRLNGILSS